MKHLESNQTRKKNIKANNYENLPADFASDESKVRLIAMPTNEELAIARITASVVWNKFMDTPFDTENSKEVLS